MISVALTSDEPIVLEALRLPIENESDMAVHGVFANGGELLEAAEKRDFDIAIVDVGPDGADGLATIVEVRQFRPTMPVVILSSLEHSEHLELALTSGARGFLLKRATQPELLESVRAIADGGSVVAPELTTRLIAQVAESVRRPTPAEPGLGLTNRQFQVLRLVAQGLSNREVAYELGIETATAKVHVSGLLKKTKTKNRVELVIFAFERRLVRPDRRRCTTRD